MKIIFIGTYIAFQLLTFVILYLIAPAIMDFFGKLFRRL